MSSRADQYLLTLARSLDAAGDSRALAVLELAASRETGGAEALALKGDLLRGRGELRQAADVYDLLARRYPDQGRARYLAALLCGTKPRIPASRPAPWPSPFVRIENFLSLARHREVMNLVSTGTDRFTPSTVGMMGVNGREPRVDLNYRASLRVCGTGPVEQWLRPLIARRLPAITTRLGLTPFTAATIEIKCTAYGDGHFFGAHSDSVYHPTRRVSFVYYFHRLPKPYSGGALVLYDGDISDPIRFLHDSATRLEPLDNSLVWFPSGTYHEVTPVASPSGRLADARFTFAGHVHAATALDTSPA